MKSGPAPRPAAGPFAERWLPRLFLPAALRYLAHSCRGLRLDAVLLTGDSLRSRRASPGSPGGGSS